MLYLIRTFLSFLINFLKVFSFLIGIYGKVFLPTYSIHTFIISNFSISLCLLCNWFYFFLIIQKVCYSLAVMKRVMFLFVLKWFFKQKHFFSIFWISWLLIDKKTIKWLRMALKMPISTGNVPFRKTRQAFCSNLKFKIKMLPVFMMNTKNDGLGSNKFAIRKFRC